MIVALTDVLFMSANAAEADRGDVGTLEDILPDEMSNSVFLTVPTVAQVQSGVEYGQQGNELTGTYVGGGGGNTYSRARVVSG